MFGWSPPALLPIRSPATLTLLKVTLTGAYALALPTSKVRLVAPVATFFCRLPTTCPLVRDTVPVDGMTTFLPVLTVTLPDVSVSVEPTDASTLSEMPLALLTVRLLNVVAFEPPIVCALGPFSVIVPVLAVKVPLLLKLPFTTWLYDDALKVVPEPNPKSPSTVSAPAAVVDAVPAMVKLPAVTMALAGMVFTPLPLRVRCPYDSVATVCEVP